MIASRDIKHPMLRTDDMWKSKDKLRAVLGRYISAPYATSYSENNLRNVVGQFAEVGIAPTRLPRQQRWDSRYNYRTSKGYTFRNSATIIDNIEGSFPTIAGDRTFNSVRNSFKGPNKGSNIVLDYKISTFPPGSPKNIPGQETGVIHIRRDTKAFQAWKSYGNYSRFGNYRWSHSVIQKFLFGYYVIYRSSYSPSAETVRLPGKTYEIRRTPITRLGNSNIPVPGILEGILDIPILDHTSIIYLADASEDITKASGLNVSVEPTYNFYASTTPPYELVSAPSSIKEHHLPNVYLLESELKNTGSTLLAPFHEEALTLGGTVDWFETQVGVAKTVTTEVEDRFYDAYSEGLQAFQNGDSEAYSNIDSNLSLSNKNFAILHSDLGVLEEDRISFQTIPFYNKIILGNDLSSASGKNSNIRIFNHLSNNNETKNFIDILQMETILRLTTETNENLGSRKFNTMVKKFSRSPEKNPTSYRFYIGNQEYTLLYDLQELMEDYEFNNRGLAIADLINSFSSSDESDNDSDMISELPFRLIRDYNIPEEEREINPEHVSEASINMFESDSTSAYIPRVIRTLEEVYSNMHAHVETLLYIIKKKASADGPVIQTFYVSPHFSNSSAAASYFYDTQVKYGKKYFYQIEKVVAIFGNEYVYMPTPDERDMYYAIRPGRPGWTFRRIPYANKMSVKVAVVPYVVPASGIETLILDKPPVPPEISFYSYKGIDNKIKILLNSGTGEFESKPVLINDADKEYFVDEYRSQARDYTVPAAQALQKKITFKSDDPVDRYQLFKLDVKPESYADFANTQIVIDPPLAIPGDITDTIEPNRKYYYCARALDVHDNVSNPGHIFEIEIINNNGQIFLRQQAIRYEKEKDVCSKSGRRFIYIEPTFQHVTFPEENENMITANPSPSTPPDSNILGEPDVDKVWGKTFKVRITSNKTGRKMDLNLTFKNSGITNTSE